MKKGLIFGRMKKIASEEGLKAYDYQCCLAPLLKKRGRISAGYAGARPPHSALPPTKAASDPLFLPGRNVHKEVRSL